MKRVVFLNDLKESDIRPESTYNEYKDLLVEDIKKYFTDPASLTSIDCPGCSAENSELIFSKMGFDYLACNKCGSWFVSPRPSDDVLRDFYKNSDAGNFLRKIFLGDTIESRSKKVFSYRLQWIMSLIEEYLPEAKVMLDYATRYPTFLKQLSDNSELESILSVYPECYEQENLLPENIRILNTSTIMADSTDIFAAFEVVERVFDPGMLFATAFKASRKNGLFVMTSTTSSGFEYKVLGEHSPNIVPPGRLNLLSLEALVSQIEKAGFEIIEVSTPGRLDIEMVKKTFDNNPDIPLDPFWKYLFSFRNENALHAFQEYLQEFQLSSHVRIAAIKK